MALPKKLGLGGEGGGYKKREIAPLPTAKTQKPKTLEGYSLFIYGRQKSGKTSFTAQLPNALHFFFEPSGTDYELFAVSPKNWQEFVDYIDQLVNGEHEFRNFVIDVIDLAYEMCLKHICGLQGLDYPPTNDFGKTWKAIKDEFRTQMQRLAFVGGLIAISHAKEKHIETRDGDEFDMIAPTASGGATELMAKWADLTGYYDVLSKGDRRLWITPSPQWEAGNRMESRFRCAETGEPLEYIPMGNSAVEAFSNFMSAFNNKLAKPKAEVDVDTEADDAKPKPKPKLALKSK